MVTQEQKKELFSGYEMKNWNFSPRIYKILAASAVFNLLAIMVFAQTNMLTRKGCDSPLVSSVCQVLDMVYVGSTLLGTNGEFVNKDYEKTELEDADITYVDVSGQTPPLEYPEGYFALANANEFAALQNINNDFSTTSPFNSSGFPNGTDLLAQPQVTPTPNNNAVTGTVPITPFDFGDGSTTVKRGRSTKAYTPKPTKYPKGKSASPGELPKLDGDETAENKDETKDKDKKDKKDEKQPDKNQSAVASEPVIDFRPNKKPLLEFADDVLAKRSEKDSKLDLTKTFKVEMNGFLTEDGKLDPKKSKYVKDEGDEEMVKIAKEAIEAISDSGMFYYLKSQGIDKVNFTLVQDDQQFYAVVTSAQKTEERAKTLSSGFNGLILIGKGLVKEEELKTLLNAARVETKGKDFVLNFAIPKPVAQAMIKKKLDEAAEAKAKAKEKEPNSTAQNTDANQKTAK